MRRGNMVYSYRPISFFHMIACFVALVFFQEAPARAEQKLLLDDCSATAKGIVDIPGSIAGRNALLITNQDYPDEVGRLAATHVDGERLCKTLKKLGFRVRHVKEANLSVFNREVSAHARRLYEAGNQGVGFFYFSGHGATAEARGDNYLIPTEAPVSRAIDLYDRAIKLGDVVDRIYTFSNESGAIANFIVIDACRNVQFPMPTRGMRGLTPVREQGGLLISFSTAPGTTAADAPHYSTALAKELLVPNRPAYLAFRAVRRRVLKATSNQQFPWMRDGLINPFFFNRTSEKSKISYALPDTTGPLVFRGSPILQDPTCNVCPQQMKPLSPPPEVGGKKADQPPLRPFAISMHEVTFDDWARCVDDGKCRGYQPADAGWGRGKHPVINVSWQDAQLYIDWLNQRSGKNFRLPSEAEWEYAASAQADAAYAHGNDPGELCKFANGGDFHTFSGIPCKDGINRGTQAVGKYEANRNGLFDMTGNVWEWVDGCWHGKPVKSGDRCPRVLKGGSWKSGASALKISSRRRAGADFSSYTIGFRVVRSIP